MDDLGVVTLDRPAAKPVRAPETTPEGDIYRGIGGLRMGASEQSIYGGWYSMLREGSRGMGRVGASA